MLQNSQSKYSKAVKNNAHLFFPTHSVSFVLSSVNRFLAVTRGLKPLVTERWLLLGGCWLALMRVGYAQTCTVITTADSGPGSLREALTCAKNKPGLDTIRFNIAGSGPHVIRIGSEVYHGNDTGGLVIDATTQPGWTQGQVVIDGSSATSAPDGLFLFERCTALRLYGLTVRNAPAGGIAFAFCQNLTLGAPGKGNIFYDNERNVPASVSTPANYSPQVQLFGCTNATVQANTFGRTETNAKPTQNMVWGLTASGENLLIGGSRSAGESNTFAHHLFAGLGIWGHLESGLNTRNIRIEGNNLGTDASGAQDWGNYCAFNFGLNSSASAFENVAFGDGSADRSNLAKFNDFIATTYGTGTKQVAFSRNSFACNDQAFEATHPSRPVAINTATTQSIVGTATAGDRVEVYISQNTGCSNAACQGTTWLGQATVSASGQWTLAAPYAAALPAGAQVTAISTGNGVTGAFAACVPVADANSCRYRDSLELVKLYSATGGDGWTNKWDLSRPMNTWWGIRLTTQGCVRRIDLSNNNLTNSIPNLNLSALEILDLDSNQLSDNLPNFDLPNLLVLDLDNNKLSGNIPVFSGLPKLQYMALNNNGLTGTIPNFNLPNLTQLLLFRNNLTGPIPNLSLPKLQTFQAYSNQINGNLPDFNFPELYQLWLYDNRLEGNIPNFSLMPKLGELWLHNNQLSGAIPNFARMPLLYNINLFNNKLSGPIPAFNLPLLQSLAVSHNELTGMEPGFNLPMLQIFHLNNNKISQLPSLTPLPIRADTFIQGVIWERGLRTFNNSLTFKDILPSISRASYTYAPQDSIFTTTTYTKKAGESLTIDLGIDAGLTTNRYQWYKNGQKWRIIDNHKLEFDTLKISDAGEYWVQVTNPVAPLLTLNGRRVRVAVSCNVISVAATPTPASCGQNNGRITLSGATGTYRWNTGATTQTLTNLGAGSYTITVTDPNGCSATATASVSATGRPVATLAPTGTRCGGSNGSINTNPSSGVPPYNYRWNTGAMTQNLPGLSANSYTVTISDATGCSATATTTVPGSSAPKATAVAADATCGVGSGGVNLSVTGGAMPYIFRWSNDATTQNLTGVPAGTYTVTVSDAANCTATATATVTVKPGMTVKLIPFSASCSQSDGAIDVVVTGGTQSYQFRWNNGASGEDLEGLSGGAYTVTVTDRQKCTATATAVVEQTKGPTIDPIVSPAKCGSKTGSINLLISGVGPFRWRWSNGDTTKMIDKLAAAAYSVTVTDRNGCTSTRTITVPPTEGPSATATITPPACGQTNGSITLNVTFGPSGSAVYRWNDGSTDKDRINLAPGTYTVSILDNNCTFTLTNTVSSPGPTIAPAITDAACQQATGTIALAVANGTVPYSFKWSHGPTTKDVNRLPPGNYQVTVTDAKQCSATATFTVKNQGAASKRMAAVADQFFLQLNIPEQPLYVLRNDSIGKDQRIRLEVLRQPRLGTADVDLNGQIRYRLLRPEGAVSDSLWYRICDLNCPALCDTAKVLLTLTQDPEQLKSKIPNAFSPNDDGVGDLFDPLNIYRRNGFDVPENKVALMIVNRQGEVVFIANPYSPWTGDNVPTGPYWYKFVLRLEESYIIEGQINLFRN